MMYWYSLFDLSRTENVGGGAAAYAFDAPPLSAHAVRGCLLRERDGAWVEIFLTADVQYANER